MNFSAYIIRQRARIRERHTGETFLYTRRNSAEPVAVAKGCGDGERVAVRPRSAREIFDELDAMQGLNKEAFCFKERVYYQRRTTNEA